MIMEKNDVLQGVDEVDRKKIKDEVEEILKKV